MGGSNTIHPNLTSVPSQQPIPHCGSIYEATLPPHPVCCVKTQQQKRGTEEERSTLKEKRDGS